MPSLSSTYRPQTFAEVTGQEPIKETLRREIATDKIGQAYLFAGARGVGKTTTARIFAKALNCLNLKDGEPCNACESCTEILAGKSMDMIEMDAASNTGVDNVREAIIEHVRYAPRRKHKVYILDEAHMLSGSAWNALLKTIEEPPAYAVFLFLTTELHKVPATIASRCQRFDFRRIPDEELKARIVEIAQKEGVTISDDVVRLVVSKADGCLRDAESLLAQLLVLGEKQINMETANVVLPVSRLPLAAELLEAWSTRNLGASLAKVEELEAQGIPMLPLFDDLIQGVRHLLIASDSVEYRQRLSRGDDGEKKIVTLVTAYEPSELSEMALMLMERRKDAKQGADPRFCLELSASAVALSLLPHSNGQTPSSAPTKTTVTASSAPMRQSMEQVKQPLPAPTPAAVTPPTVAPPASPSVTATTAEPLKPSAPPVANIEPAASTAAPAITATAGDKPTTFTLSQVQQKWPSFLRAMDEKSKALSFVLKITQPESVEGNILTLRFQYPFHREKTLNESKTRHMIEELFANLLGVERVQCQGIVVNPVEGEESGSRDVVSNIMRAFGGQLVDGVETGTTGA